MRLGFKIVNYLKANLENLFYVADPSQTGREVFGTKLMIMDLSYLPRFLSHSNTDVTELWQLTFGRYVYIPTQSLEAKSVFVLVNPKGMQKWNRHFEDIIGKNPTVFIHLE